MAKAKTEFTWLSLLARFFFAMVLVLATYNPEGYSYYHWAIEPLLTGLDFSIIKAFVGIVLLIGWMIFIRATIRSLGPIGIVLALAFFGTLIWLIADAGIIPTDSVRAVTYIVLVIICGILAAGMSWSHVRWRFTGQFDTDEIEQ